MMNHRAACVQMCSTTDVHTNLSTCNRLIQIAKDQDARLVVLPEMLALCQPGGSACIQEAFDNGPIQDAIKTMAQQHKMWIIAGTIPLKSSVPSRPTASTLVIDHHGTVKARYDKIHLFDADLSHNESYRESDHTQPGNQTVICDTPVGRVGLAVCYDLRFPEQFRCLQQQGAEIIAIPAAFVHTTGQYHWEVLLRARAIENSCYVIASNQCGHHESGRHSFGHSMIIDPWGEILTLATQQETTISANVSQQLVKTIRTNTPFSEHQTIRCVENHKPKPR